MYYTWIFFAVVLSLVQIHHAADKRECSKLFRLHSGNCCKDERKIHFLLEEEVKECFKDLPPKGSRPHPPPRDDDEANPPPPPKCEVEKCMAAHLGFTDQDGKFQKDILQATLDKHFTDIPDIKKDIEDKCVNGDLNNYAPEDFCDAIKVMHCVQAQFVKACNSWDTEGKCSETKALLEECKDMI